MNCTLCKAPDADLELEGYPVCEKCMRTISRSMALFIKSLATGFEVDEEVMKDCFSGYIAEVGI